MSDAVPAGEPGCLAEELGLLPRTVLEERWVDDPTGHHLRIGEPVSWDGIEWPFAAEEPIAPPTARGPEAASPTTTRRLRRGRRAG